MNKNFKQEFTKFQYEQAAAHHERIKKLVSLHKTLKRMRKRKGWGTNYFAKPAGEK
jgi:hypothetical protein